jgi:hypothetical protein
LAAGKRGLLGLMSPPRTVMSRTVNVNPLLVLVSILIGSSIGDWFGGPDGAAPGAWHQTGWTGLIADVIRRRYGLVRSSAEIVRIVEQENRP